MKVQLNRELKILILQWLEKGFIDTDEALAIFPEKASEYWIDMMATLSDDD